MILDSQLKFSATQAVTAAATSTNCIDASEARNIGEGKDIYVLTTVDVTLTDGGSNTGLQVILYGGATANATTGQQLMFTIPAQTAAGAGPFYGKISPSFVAATFSGDYEFLSLNYNPTGANLTAGSFSSYLVCDIAGFKAYAKNYTIK